MNDGIDEISKYLSVKNTIPNVSAVLFRKDCLAEVLEQHLEHYQHDRPLRRQAN